MHLCFLGEFRLKGFYRGLCSESCLLQFSVKGPTVIFHYNGLLPRLDNSFHCIIIFCKKIKASVHKVNVYFHKTSLNCLFGLKLLLWIWTTFIFSRTTLSAKHRVTISPVVWKFFKILRKIPLFFQSSVHGWLYQGNSIVEKKKNSVLVVAEVH